MSVKMSNVKINSSVKLRDGTIKNVLFIKYDPSRESSEFPWVVRLKGDNSDYCYSDSGFFISRYTTDFDIVSIL